MFLKYSNSMFYLILFFTPIMVISSSSWMLMWLSMEINLMMFIPLLMNKINLNSTSAAIKYFIVQAGASIILIFSFIFFSKLSSFNSININNEMITTSMALKAGVPPLQFWLPQVMEVMEFNDILILMTWQKISPLFIMNFFITNMIFLIIFISSIIGSLGGINQNSLKKMLAYSSMSHSSWIIMTLFLNMKLWAIYFFMYSMMAVVLISTFMEFKINLLSEFSTYGMSVKNKILISMNMMSLGGLPPFIGFLSKFLIVNYVIQYFFMKIILVVMIMMSLISLFYYMKIIYSFMFKYGWILKNYMMHKNKMSMVLAMLTLSSNFILPGLIILI